MKKMALLLPFFAILFVGCSAKTPEPEIRYVEKIVEVSPSIPDNLKTCKDVVIDPQRGFENQSEVARLIIDMYDAHQDCKEKLESLNIIIQSED